MTDKLTLVIFSIALGAVISLHLAMNARAAEVLGSPRTGNTIFWVVGALTGLAIWLAGGEWEALRRVSFVPPALWLAGALGASLVLGISFAMPRLGIATTTAALLAGQLATGALLGHFGWLTSAPDPLSLSKLAGLAAIAVGVFLVM